MSGMGMLKLDMTARGIAFGLDDINNAKEALINAERGVGEEMPDLIMGAIAAKLLHEAVSYARSGLAMLYLLEKRKGGNSLQIEPLNSAMKTLFDPPAKTLFEVCNVPMPDGLKPTDRKDVN